MLCEGRGAVASRVVLATLAAGNGTHFSTCSVAAEAARCLAAEATWTDARVLAWVLMPDRWQGLVQIAGDAELSRVVEQAKDRVARQLRQSHPRLGNPWAAGFHEHALRRKDDVLRAAHHVLMTPVRAGLAGRLRDYPYWDAAWL